MPPYPNPPHSKPPSPTAVRIVTPHSPPAATSPSFSIPSRTKSAGFGRFEIFCSRLSARMCFCNSRCWPWMAGAAVEPGRMLPD